MHKSKQAANSRSQNLNIKTKMFYGALLTDAAINSPVQLDTIPDNSF